MHGTKPDEGVCDCTPRVRAEMCGVTKTFGGAIALRDVSFHLQRGEILGLIGPNGAGKTTVARLLAGLLSADRGVVGIRNSGGRLGELGYAPQELGLQLSSPGLENLSYWGGLQGVPPSASLSQGRQLAARLGLSGLDRRVASMSLGEQRKLQVITALVHEPSLVILDEPTTYMDAAGRQELLEVLCERARNGASILYSTHLFEEAETICQNVVVLHAGRVRYFGDTQTFIHRYGSAEIFFEFDGVAPKANDLSKDLGATVETLSAGRIRITPNNGEGVAQAVAQATAGFVRAGVTPRAVNVVMPGLGTAVPNFLRGADGIAP